ncbi:hypothetical protein ACWKWC_02770 [Geodermatophilus nigrescens]
METLVAKTVAPPPIPFRLRTQEQRDRLELVAAHQGVSVSALAATVLMSFVDDYIEGYGLETLVEEAKAAARQREQLLQRHLNTLLETSVARSGSNPETSSPSTPSA